MPTDLSQGAGHGLPAKGSFQVDVLVGPQSFDFYEAASNAKNTRSAQHDHLLQHHVDHRTVN